MPSRVVSEAKGIGSVPFLNSLRVERFQLQNGLTILLVSDPAAPVISFHTWFRVGARHEQEGRTGIAHLFEHLMFKETSNMPVGSFSRLLEEAGARDLNAWTWYDETCYMESIPKQHLELVLQLERDRMSNLILNEQQLEAEREVVLNERSYRCEDDPYGRVAEVLSATAFDVHPYRWPVIGWRQDIEAITLEDCMAFYRSFYAPNNALLVVAGDFETPRLLERIIHHYGGLEAQVVPWPEIPVEPPQTEQRRQTLQLAVESELLQIGLKNVPLNHPDRPALQILDLALFHGKSSRLERLLVDAEIASSVGSMLPPFVDPCLYEIEINLREDRTAEEAEQVLFSEFERVVSDGLSQEELTRAHRVVQVGTYQELRDNSSRAQFLGTYEVAAGGFENGLTFLDRVAEVSLQDVQRVAATWLRPELSTVIIARPEKAAAGSKGATGSTGTTGSTGATGPTGVESELLLEVTSEITLDPAAAREETAASGAADVGHAPQVDGPGVMGEVDPQMSSPMLERLAAQVTGAGPWQGSTEPPWPQSHVALPGGARLTLVEERAVPLVTMQIIFPGGAMLETEETEGMAAFMAEMLTRGTRHRSRESFEDALDDLGASFDVTAGSESLIVSASGLREHWTALLALVSEALLEPVFDPQEHLRLVDETIASILEARNDDKALADHWFARAVFQGHVFGRSELGTPSSVRSFEPSAVKAMYLRGFPTNGALLGVAGDLPLDQLTRDLSRLIEALPASKEQVPQMPQPVMPTGRTLYLIDKPGRTQTQIVLGHPGLPAAHPDQPYLSLGTMAFGGSAFTTRLMHEVREVRGWSYGAYARADHHRSQGVFTIWVFPAMSDAVDCLALIYQLYERIQREGITEAELTYARKALLNGTAFDEDNPERSMRVGIRRAWLGVDRNAVLQAVQSASLEQVNAVLRKHYHPGSLSGAVVCTVDQLRSKVVSELEGIATRVLSYDADCVPSV